MQTEMSMRENGKMIQIMAQVNIIITVKEPNLKAIGSKTHRQARGKSHGQTGPLTSVSTLTAKSMESGLTSGLMDQHMRVTYLTTICTDMVTTDGQTTDSMTVSGT